MCHSNQPVKLLICLWIPKYSFLNYKTSLRAFYLTVTALLWLLFSHTQMFHFNFCFTLVQCAATKVTLNIHHTLILQYSHCITGTKLQTTITMVSKNCITLTTYLNYTTLFKCLTLLQHYLTSCVQSSNKHFFSGG